MFRRKFVALSGLGLAASMAPEAIWAANLTDIGLQLWTLRDAMDQDPLNTLKKVSKIGFTQIEGYANKKGHFFGFSAQEMKQILNDLNLTLPGTHFITGRYQPEMQNTLQSGWESAFDTAAFLGVKYIVCSWLKEEEYKTAEDCKKTADFLNQAAQNAKRFGLKFLYHNHDFEFIKYSDGKLPYDLLLENTDPDLVKFEMDLYWITLGKQQPANYFEKYPGRFPCWHIKDMDKKDPNRNTEIGSGSIKFADILKLRQKAGLEFCYLEQETYNFAPIESAAKGYEYLKKLSF